MLTVLKDYPDNVLAISGSGTISAEDYRKVLIPEAEARIARHGKIRFLYVLGKEYETFTAGAVFSDMTYGIGHMSAFERIAVVSDIAWIRDAMLLFAPFLHAPIHVFSTEEIGAARQWLLAKEAD